MRLGAPGVGSPRGESAAAFAWRLANRGRASEVRAQRVFGIGDNGSSHRGQVSVARLAREWPKLVLVHLPFYASWLNQIEIVFSVIQRKLLTPNDFTSLQAVVDRLDAFEHHYNQVAKPFEWNFTRRDLAELIARVADHQPRLSSPPDRDGTYGHDHLVERRGLAGRARSRA
jgi:transposase